MKIAILGSGNVGGTLARRWAKLGHEIAFGSRKPDSKTMKAVVSRTGPNAAAYSVIEAASLAQVVLLAVPWTAARDTIEAAGDLGGKVLMDCTNPLTPGLDGLALGTTTSAAEEIAAWASGARVVKAFNMTGSKNMDDPVYSGQPATMFICGDDSEARKIVSALASELGFEVVDTGGLVAARYLEPLAMLWIHLAYQAGMGSDIAIKLLRR